MARSGSYDFSLTGDSIISGAIRIVKGMGGKFGGSTAGQAEKLQARDTLNMMLKEWQGQGVGLWLNKEIVVFLAYRDGQYSLGSSGDQACLVSELVETELSSSSSASGTTLTVDSITGIADGDVIGIELDDDTLDWTTVNGSPSGSTVTITTGLTSAAGVDNNVYTYTNIAQRPLSVKDARLVSDSQTETPLYVCTRQEWYDLPNKQSNGTPSQVFYDRQLDSGILYVWPRPNKVDSYIKLSCRYPVQDFDAASDDPDFPQELHRAVKFNLAVDLAFEYEGVDQNRFAQLKNHATFLYNTMAIYDQEYGSYFFEAFE